MTIATPQLYAFITGMVCALAGVAALIFARFYKRTGDRLFIFFSVAFAMLSVGNVVLLMENDRYGDLPESERHPLIYGIRLVAFSIILFAIFDKNRTSGKLRP